MSNPNLIGLKNTFKSLPKEELGIVITAIQCERDGSYDGMYTDEFLKEINMTEGELQTLLQKHASLINRTVEMFNEIFVDWVMGE